MRCVYKDASGMATTYYLMCARMADGEKFPTDIESLVSLGDKLTNLDFKFKEFEDILSTWRGDATDLVDTFEARYLACKLEDALLRGSEEEFSSEQTERLRGLGLDTLEKIGGILKRAGEPEFEEYASALAEFFEEWRKWADELYVTNPNLGLNIIFYIFGREEPIPD